MVGEEMEESKRGAENGSPSESRPPNPLAGAYRKCLGGDSPATLPCGKTLVRRPSLVSLLLMMLAFFWGLFRIMLFNFHSKIKRKKSCFAIRVIFVLPLFVVVYS